ncbi:MAG: AMP-binding protein [Rhodanobacter sp.]
MAVDPDTCSGAVPPRLPMLVADNAGQVFAWRRGGVLTAGEFLAHVHQVAATLPERAAVVNLCEDRYAFMVAFCAAMLQGQITLLPPSRAPRAVDEVMAMHADSYALGEQTLESAPQGYRQLPDFLRVSGCVADVAPLQVFEEQVVAIAYTSGSTGTPQPTRKTWGSFHASTARNLAMLRAVFDGTLGIVATVPPQHMYGVETSVLLPLLGGHSVHAGRPFFPADIAMALAEIAEPRMLVTTPVHLRALVESGIRLPPLALMLSATAPLSLALARAAEDRFQAPLREVFGSTETCVFASRRATVSEDWELYPDVRLFPQADGTLVEAPQLAQAVTLADIVRLSSDRRYFRLQGRSSDLLEIAGKRTSLSDLTRRLLAVPGVCDGVMLQFGDGNALGVQRIAALAVAPGLLESDIVDALRQAVDPVFLPRPLRLVEALPRSETGKLPRAALLAMLRDRNS